MILITLLTVLIISIGIFPGTLTGILGSITLYTGFVAK
jgi:hypothetical protein